MPEESPSGVPKSSDEEAHYRLNSVESKHIRGWVRQLITAISYIFPSCIFWSTWQLSKLYFWANPFSILNLYVHFHSYFLICNIFAKSFNNYLSLNSAEMSLMWIQSFRQSRIPKHLWIVGWISVNVLTWPLGPAAPLPRELYPSNCGWQALSGATLFIRGPEAISLHPHPYLGGMKMTGVFFCTSPHTGSRNTHV